MIANVLLQISPTLGMGTIGQTATFSEHVYVAYQIKGNHKILLQPPPPPHHPWPWGRGPKVKIPLSKYGHVTYKNKGNHECSNIVANDLPADPLTLGMGSTGQKSTFSDQGHVAYQIKRNHKSLLQIIPNPLTQG